MIQKLPGHVLRCGVDAVTLAVFQARIDRSRNDWVSRFMTEGEVADARGLLQSIAARWAAKEATMKALGIGIGQVDPTDIEVVKIDDVPTLRLHRGAKVRAEQLGLTDWSLSLSHTQEIAIAFVVAMGSRS